MKDWWIEKNPGLPILRHLCKKGCREGGCWCDCDEEGWYCPGCHTRAPEEMGFVADLGACEPLTKNNYLTGDTNWFIQ